MRNDRKETLETIVIPANMNVLESKIIQAHAAYQILKQSLEEGDEELRKQSLEELDSIFKEITGFNIVMKSYSIVTSPSSNLSPCEKSHVSGK